MKQNYGDLDMFGLGNSPLVISQPYYDASGNLAYEAFALQGASTSESKWRVVKYSYDASGNKSSKRVSKVNQIADNYLSLTYT